MQHWDQHRRARWVLVNASPDVRYQLTYFECRPSPQTRRSPIEAILLSDADLDHTLGLLLLRESGLPLPIYALETIKEAVEEGLRMTDVLSRYCGSEWLTPPLDFEPLLCRNGAETSLDLESIGKFQSISRDRIDAGPMPVLSTESG
jgi:pyrroloquinoline quinone biosynthesis protein B